MSLSPDSRPPLPPFTRETALQKVRLAEDGWNSRDPVRVSLVYTEDSQWRNRAEFPRGRAQIVEFLTRKWAKEHDYRLIKELWAFTDNRIAVRFAYEWHDDAGNWFRSYGNENWEFDERGLMRPMRSRTRSNWWLSSMTMRVTSSVRKSRTVRSMRSGSWKTHDGARPSLIFV